MGQADFYGYTRDIKPNGQLISSEFATLSVAGSRVTIVQAVQATYGQRAEPKFEAGSSALYWVTGQPMGDITMGRLVGADGLSGIKMLEGGCGSLRSVSVAFNGSGGCADAVVAANGLNFRDAVPVSVGITFSAGQLEIGENFSIRAAHMSIG